MRPSDEYRYSREALLIDGVHFGEHVVLAAVGVDEHGDKHVLGLREACARANPAHTRTFQ